MKAIVLAGGHATRLWPLTRNRAKPLLPLAGKPLIDHLLEGLEGEMDEILISTNEKFAEDFRDYLEEYGRDARVAVEEQSSEEEKPGTIGAIIQLLEEEEVEDDLLIVGGDNYFGIDFEDLLEFFEEVDGPVNAVYDLEDRKDAGEFGVVETDGERITGFEEKPEEPPSSLISTALYLFPEEQLDLFHRYEEFFSEKDVPREDYLDEPGRLIEWAHRRTAFYAYPFTGGWFDIGTPENYLEAQGELDGRRVEGEVKSSELGGNVWVMEGAVIKGSEVENCIVFPNARIEDAVLEDSIVDRKASVKGVELEGSVVGELSQIV
ncbi:MAG: NDP-sugar synthase [Candidatus Nanohaloarchaea archaeon]|nr:NDP-sugar synthase [Candidatus Nanohaloarchaea archaeon]